MILDKINNVLKQNLLKHVVIVYDEKYTKKGQLLLFSISNFNINLILKTTRNENRTYELPIPFDITMEENNIVLDYTIKTLSNNCPVKLVKLTNITPSEVNKFYNNKIKIKVN